MPTAVDLFAGAGGISEGLRNAGWEVIAACDNDRVAARTYSVNHPATPLVLGDIQLCSTIDRIAQAVGSREVDAVFIAAPCQPFSSQNQRRGGDARELLIVKSLEVVRRLAPGLVFFENVTGLKTKTYRPVIDAVRFELLAMGYVFSGPQVHDASDFGVPQLRKRCVMLAARSQAALDIFEAMDPDYPQTTVHFAIGDLLPLNSEGAHPTDAMHRARKHSPIPLERLRHIPKDGGSRKSLPAELRLACHKNDLSFPDVYGRMQWSRPCMTLTTGCTDVTKGRYAHPEQDRAITAREAARLQTFDDEYIFAGNGTQVSRQIGNAVPPLMIERIAPTLEAALIAQDVAEPVLEAETVDASDAPEPWGRVFGSPLYRQTDLTEGVQLFGDLHEIRRFRSECPYPKLRGPPFGHDTALLHPGSVRTWQSLLDISSA